MDTALFIKLLNVVALAAIMFSIGLTLEFKQVLASVRQGRSMLLGIVANFILVPLVTVGLLYGFQAAPLVSAGFLTLALCPGAPVGPPFASIAKGDVSLATGLAVVLAGLSAVMSPLLLGILLNWIAPGSNLSVDWLAIVRALLITQLLPLALGLGIHSVAPGLAPRIVKPIHLIATLLLLLLVGLIVATQYESLAAIRTRAWLGMAALLVVCLGIGWLCGGPGLARRKALATTTATRNVAVGLMIVGSSFAGTPAVTAVVAFGLFSTLGALACALLLARFRSTGSDPSDAPAL